MLDFSVGPIREMVRVTKVRDPLKDDLGEGKGGHGTPKFLKILYNFCKFSCHCSFSPQFFLFSLYYAPKRHIFWRVLEPTCTKK